MYRGGGTMINDTPLLVEDFNDEFNNVMDEMYDFYIFGRDYYLSLREQFTADLVKDYVNSEQVILEGAFANTIKKIIDGIIKFIKTMWRKFIGLFTKASNNVIEKADNGDKKPLIPDELKKAVEDKDEIMCRVLISDAMLTGVLWYKDVKFKQSDAMLEYIKRKLPSVMEPYDGRELDMDKSHWDKDFLDRDRVSVSTNFSQERYDYHKKVILYVTSKTNWKKENKEGVIGYNYQDIITNFHWKKLEKLCDKLYTKGVTTTRNLDEDIEKILMDISDNEVVKFLKLNGHDASDTPQKSAEFELGTKHNYVYEVLFTFDVDNMSEISQSKIRDYIFDGEEKKKINIDKKYAEKSISDFKDIINDLEKRVKMHEKELNTTIKILEGLKSKISKDTKYLDKYKTGIEVGTKYYDSNVETQKVIINFLKQIQKNVNDCITFEAKVVQVKISVLNEGITFVKSNSN